MELSTSNLYEPNISMVLGRVKSAIYKKCLDDIVTDLKSALQEYHQAEYCITFSSGFWALVAAAFVKARKNAKEILLPSLTYRRLADAVYWTGNIPVFVDIDRHNLSISPANTENHLSDNTALIIAVHPIVNCCDVYSLISISNSYGIPIIFDAVESVHETFCGKRIGSFGVGEVFSLHASKLLNGIEGGYVCTSDPEFASNIEYFSTKLNASINPIHAAFALESLREIATNVAHNKKVYQRYCVSLASIDGIEICKFDESEQTSYKNIVVRLNPEKGWDRGFVIKYLNERRILARAHYYPPLHLKTYHYPVIIKEMDNTNCSSNIYLNLPCGQRVTLSDVDWICETIGKIPR